MGSIVNGANTNPVDPYSVVAGWTCEAGANRSVIVTIGCNTNRVASDKSTVALQSIDGSGAHHITGLQVACETK